MSFSNNRIRQNEINNDISPNNSFAFFPFDFYSFITNIFILFIRVHKNLFIGLFTNMARSIRDDKIQNFIYLYPKYIRTFWRQNFYGD